MVSKKHYRLREEFVSKQIFHEGDEVVVKLFGDVFVKPLKVG